MGAKQSLLADAVGDMQRLEGSKAAALVQENILNEDVYSVMSLIIHGSTAPFEFWSPVGGVDISWIMFGYDADKQDFVGEPPCYEYRVVEQFMDQLLELKELWAQTVHDKPDMPHGAHAIAAIGKCMEHLIDGGLPATVAVAHCYHRKAALQLLELP